MTPVSGDVIGKAIQTVPEIIRAAAQSLNGILALMILILGTLGYFTIRKAGAKERVGVFVMLFAGVVLFGVAVVQSQRRDLVPSKIATPSPTAQMPPAQPAAPLPPYRNPKDTSGNPRPRTYRAPPRPPAITLKRMLPIARLFRT